MNTILRLAKFLFFIAVAFWIGWKTGMIDLLYRQETLSSRVARFQPTPSVR